MTGYDGYIGAVMIPALLDEGHEIVKQHRSAPGEAWLKQRHEN